VERRPSQQDSRCTWSRTPPSAAEEYNQPCPRIIGDCRLPVGYAYAVVLWSLFCPKLASPTVEEPNKVAAYWLLWFLAPRCLTRSVEAPSSHLASLSEGHKKLEHRRLILIP
jgi:hypothetical protein